MTIFENYDTVLKATEVSMNSAGTSERKYQYITESLQATINNLVSSWEHLVLNFEEAPHIFKFIVNSGTSLIETFDFLINEAKILNALFVVFGTTVGIKLFKSLSMTLSQSKLVAVAMTLLGIKTKTTTATTTALSLSMDKLRMSMMLATTTTGKLNAMLSFLGKGNAILLAISALSVAWMAYSSSVAKAEEKTAKMREEYEASAEAVAEVTNEYDTQIVRIKELQTLKEKSGLTLAQQEELEHLKKVNSELFVKKEYLEAEARIKKVGIEDNAVTSYNKKSEKSSGRIIQDEDGNIDYNIMVNTANVPVTQAEKLIELQKVLNIESESYREQKELVANTLERIIELNQKIAIEEANIRLNPDDDNSKALLSGYKSEKSALTNDLQTQQTALDSLSKKINNILLLFTEKMSAIQTIIAELPEGATKATASALFSGFQDSLTDVNKLVNGVEELEKATNDTAQSFAHLTKEMEDLSSIDSLLTTIDGEMSDIGMISPGTLKEIISEYEHLEKSVQLYQAGIITAGELTKELELIQTEQIIAYNKALAENMQVNEAFYDETIDQTRSAFGEITKIYGRDVTSFESFQALKVFILDRYSTDFANTNAELIKNFNETYNADLKNFGDIQKAKAEMHSAVMKSMFGATGDVNMASSAHRNYREYQEFKAQKELDNDPLYQNMLDAVAKAEAVQKEIDRITSSAIKSTYTGKTPKSSKAEKNSKDAWLEEYKTKVEEIKHLRDMDLIDDKQYYESIEKLSETYLKGRSKYLSEYRAVELELYNLRKEFDQKDLDNMDFTLFLTERKENTYDEQVDLYKKMQDKVHQMAQNARAMGIKEDDDFIQGLQKQWNGYLDKIREIGRKAFDDKIAQTEHAISIMDFTGGKEAEIKKSYQTILDLIEKRIKTEKNLTAEQVRELQTLWMKYYQDMESMEKEHLQTKKDSLEDIIDRTVELIKHEKEEQKKALEEELSGYEKIIKKRKEMLQQQKDEHDYQKQLAEKQKSVADIQSKLSELQFDNTVAGRAKRLELEAQLKKAQEDLGEYQYDKEISDQEDALDKELENFQDHINDQMKVIEDYLSEEGRIRQDAMKRIEQDGKRLYQQLIEYNRIYGDGVDLTITNSWNNAQSALESYNTGQLSVLETLRLITEEMDRIDTSSPANGGAKPSVPTPDAPEDVPKDDSNDFSIKNKKNQLSQQKYLHNLMVKALAENNTGMIAWIKASRKEWGNKRPAPFVQKCA